MKTKTSSLMDGNMVKFENTNTLPNQSTILSEIAAEQIKRNVQKLIDKDIFDQATLAMEEHYGSGCETEIDAYFRGAKWMQQELTNVDNVRHK